MTVVRTRWAAIGAALAVALGAGGIGLVSATDPEDALTLVSMTPCRVADTRPAPETVGSKTTPMSAGEVHTIKAHGDNGNCTGIPVSAKALSLNVTATAATLPTFVTIWAAGEAQPNASSLNPVPDAPPTPNAVTTGLNSVGEFSIFNLAGTVDIIVDINGYYVDHNHDDRYYTHSQVDQIVAEATAAEDWRIELQPTDFTTFFPAEPFPAVVRGTGNPRSVEGLALPDNDNLSAWFGWTLPSNFERGSTVQVEIRWLPDNLFGPPPTECNYIITTSQVAVTRAGAVPFYADVMWPNDSTDATYAVGHPLGEAGTYPVQSLVLTIDDNRLEPGDSVLALLGRDGDDGSDKCQGRVYVVGATVEEAAE